MRILTLNLWHAMAPQGAAQFVALEPRFRRELREKRQLEELERCDADLLLLQEVNPLAVRSQHFSQRLQRLAFEQSDLAGFKLKGLGWPWNLNSGLLILARSTLQPRQLRSQKLSGAKWSFESSWLSWQWSESRYAQFVECLLPNWGRVLVVNCHLHHGLEWTSELQKQIETLKSQELLSESAALELKDRLSETNRRREQEVEQLLKRIMGLRERYSLVLLGGDLNLTPESLAYQSIREFGFEDLWLQKHTENAKGATFDESRNHANHIFTRRFPLSIETFDLSFSPKTRQAVFDLLTSHERRPRRIDYLFALGNGLSPQVESLRLLGIPQGDEVPLSDHFGLLTDLEVKR